MLDVTKDQNIVELIIQLKVVGTCSLVINSTMSNPREVNSNPSFSIF